MLTIALPTGRLGTEARKLFGEDGPGETGRRLEVVTERYRFLFVKPSDVGVFVERGAADLGIMGRDTLLERPVDVLRPLDLPIGGCRLVLAARPGVDLAALHARGVLRIASKYARYTSEVLVARRWVADVIPLSGSIEVAVTAGLADAIVDITQTGSTLRENGLVIYEELEEISGCVVLNRASFALRRRELGALVSRLASASEAT